MTVRATPRPAMPVPVQLGVLGNATVLGVISLAFPLALADRGLGKLAIAAFFAGNAVAAVAVNVTVSVRVTRLTAPARVLRGCLAAAGGGLAVMAAGPPRWALYLCGAATMAATVSFPMYLHAVRGLVDRQRTGAAVARLRMLFVVGYITGLGLVTPASAYGTAGPLWLAAALVAATTTTARSGRPPGIADDTPPPASGERSERGYGSRPGRASLLVAIGAILLLKASDSIRLVYLPLFATGAGLSTGRVTALFLITAVVEIAVLPLLGRAADRAGPAVTLRMVSLCGALSFVLVAIGAGYPVLVVSSLVYAVFAAGFQSVGMVLLGQLLTSGTAAGAGLFTILMQVGSLTGIAAPLAVPGYRAGLFWIPVVLCLAAAVLLPRWNRDALPRAA